MSFVNRYPPDKAPHKLRRRIFYLQKKAISRRPSTGQHAGNQRLRSAQLKMGHTQHSLPCETQGSSWKMLERPRDPEVVEHSKEGALSRHNRELETQGNWVNTHKNWASASRTKRYHGQGKVGEKSHQLLRTAWGWRAAGTGRQFRLILSSHVSQPHSRVSSTPSWLVQNLLGNLNWTLCVGGWVGRHPSWVGKDVRVWRVGVGKVGGGKQDLNMFYEIFKESIKNIIFKIINSNICF